MSTKFVTVELHTRKSHDGSRRPGAQKKCQKREEPPAARRCQKVQSDPRATGTAEETQDAASSKKTIRNATEIKPRSTPPGECLAFAPGTKALATRRPQLREK